MDSADSSVKSKPNSWMSWKDRLVEFQQGRGKLSLLTELIGIDAMEQGAAESQKNRNAESAFVRRKVWGEKESADGDGVKEDGVAGHVLGDQTTNHYHPKPSLGPLASMAIGAGLLATGIGIPVGAWMLAGGAKDVVVPPVVEKPIEQPQEPPSERPAVNVGGLELRLGK